MAIFTGMRTEASQSIIELAGYFCINDPPPPPHARVLKVIYSLVLEEYTRRAHPLKALFVRFVRYGVPVKPAAVNSLDSGPLLG